MQGLKVLPGVAGAPSSGFVSFVQVRLTSDETANERREVRRSLRCHGNGEPPTSLSQEISKTKLYDTTTQRPRPL